MSVTTADQPTNASRSAGFLRNWRFAPFAEAWAWHYRKVVWLLILAFYLLSFNGLWRPTPDSALYLSIARSLARGEGYVYLGEAHRMAYPGLPYLVAAAMRLFGDQAITIVIALMTAMSLASIAACYGLSRLVVRPGAAVIVTVFTAVNYKLYDLTYDILTDIPFLLGTMLVLLGAAWSGVAPAPRLSEEAQVPTARHRKLGWVLLPAGLILCAVMRPTFYLLAGCLVIAGVIQIIRVRRVRARMAISGVVTLVGLILLGLIVADPRRADITSDVYEQAMSYHLRNAIADITIPLGHAWKIICPELPSAFFGYSWSVVLDPVVVPILLIATVWLLWRWPLAILWIAGTLLIQLIVEPIPRYMLPIVPLLALVWWELAWRANERFSQHPANIIAIAVYVTLVPGFFRGIGQVWYEQYRRPFMTYYHQGKLAAVDEMAQLIRERVPEGAVVLTPEKTDRILTYLTDRWSVSPDQPIPERFREKPVWIVFAKNDPDWRSQILPLVKLGPREGATFSDYREKLGVLMLRQATWHAPAKAN